MLHSCNIYILFLLSSSTQSTWTHVCLSNNPFMVSVWHYYVNTDLPERLMQFQFRVISKRLAEIKASMCVRRIRQEMEVAFHLLQSNFNLNLSLSSRLSNCLATKQEACTVLVSASGRRHSAISVCLLKAMFLLRRTLNVYCFLLSSEAHFKQQI